MKVKSTKKDINPMVVIEAELIKAGYVGGIGGSVKKVRGKVMYGYGSRRWGALLQNPDGGAYRNGSVLDIGITVTLVEKDNSFTWSYDTAAMEKQALAFGGKVNAKLVEIFGKSSV